MMGNIKNKKGFTLIEILVVVALIAILATITFVAINPAKNFGDTRNAQRSSDIGEIGSAISQYISEQGHSLTDFGTIATCPSTTPIGTGASSINLATLLVETYIPAIPKDPSNGTDAATGYTLCKTAANRITVAAPNAENGKSISIKR